MSKLIHVIRANKDFDFIQADINCPNVDTLGKKNPEVAAQHNSGRNSTEQTKNESMIFQKKGMKENKSNISENTRENIKTDKQDTTEKLKQSSQTENSKQHVQTGVTTQKIEHKSMSSDLQKVKKSESIPVDLKPSKQNVLSSPVVDVQKTHKKVNSHNLSIKQDKNNKLSGNSETKLQAGSKSSPHIPILRKTKSDATDITGEHAQEHLSKEGYVTNSKRFRSRTPTVTEDKAVCTTPTKNSQKIDATSRKSRSKTISSALKHEQKEVVFERHDCASTSKPFFKPTDSKSSNALHELISTEESYCNDMHILLDEYLNPILTLSPKIPVRQMAFLINNAKLIREFTEYPF